MEKIWLKHYPTGVPAEIDVTVFPSLLALLEESFERFRERPACLFMGLSLTFGEIDDLSRAFAAYLQAQGLERGDRVALMMPNVPQYPIAIAGALRAGFVVVNVNPLYTPRSRTAARRPS
jgi:long-chain acyl-CoA synthetase